MKTFTVIVSRYNSVAIEVEAADQENAESLAWERMEKESEELFDKFYDQYEVIESYDSNEQ